MGLPKQVFKAMLHENERRPLQGAFGLFGKQTVHFDESWLDRAGIQSILGIPDLSIETETSTRHAADLKRLDDKSLLEACFDVKCQIFDRSKYEGADQILDLNIPLPENLRETCDVLYTGGSLDNIFDPAMVIRNASKMLRPGGRMFGYEGASGLLGCFLFFSPEWLYSFFAVNNYKSAKVYLLHQESEGKSRFDYKTTVYEWTPTFTRQPEFNYFSASKTHSGIQYVLFVAEKGEDSTDERVPVQLQYLDDNSDDWTKKSSAYRVQPSLEDLTREATNEPRNLPYGSDHFNPLLVDF